MKFKKEDRINRSLIEKTLRNPIDFNLDELEKEAGDIIHLIFIKLCFIEKNIKLNSLMFYHVI